MAVRVFEVLTAANIKHLSCGMQSRRVQTTDVSEELLHLFFVTYLYLLNVERTNISLSET
jgi:hypothetical protein